MLVAKISFYFENAKKTGEKFQKKLGFQKYCTHHVIHRTDIRVQ